MGLRISHGAWEDCYSSSSPNLEEFKMKITGSEKQIAWANDIIGDLNLAEVIEHGIEFAKNTTSEKLQLPVGTPRRRLSVLRQHNYLSAARRDFIVGKGAAILVAGEIDASTIIENRHKFDIEAEGVTMLIAATQNDIRSFLYNPTSGNRLGRVMGRQYPVVRLQPQPGLSGLAQFLAENISHFINHRGSLKIACYNGKTEADMMRSEGRAHAENVISAYDLENVPCLIEDWGFPIIHPEKNMTDTINIITTGSIQ